jgi:hypothetical protein
MADDGNHNKHSHERESDEHTSSPSGKRNKREWLAFRGTKHTRVGNDFQVTTFPTPPHQDEKKANDAEPKNDEKKPAEERINEEMEQSVTTENKDSVEA